LFKKGNDTILAISDSSIIGKTFEDDELTLTVSKEFYGGHKCNIRDALNLIKNATIVNAVGKNIVELMIKKNLINKNAVLFISDIPHAQIISVIK